MRPGSNTALQDGATVAGHRLLRQLGQGTQSRVFLAEHLGSGQVVALKVASIGNAEGGSSARRAFLQAAQLAQGLVHPHIVSVLDAGVEGPLAWLRMEAVPGTDLTRYTRSPRLLPEVLVLRVAERVALALAHAHRQGVVHRDLKPANVLVDWPTDTVKLADFGLARTAGAVQTGTGIVLGTPAYMAPEQLAGSLPSAATDLYALGVLLFEMLAGRLPHEGRSMGELLKQVAQQTAPDLSSLRPDLPPALARRVADLVARLLAKSAHQRPADAAAVAAELHQLQIGLPGAGTGPVADADRGSSAGAGAKSR